MKKQTILFVGANPHAAATSSETIPLPIDQEVRAIQLELKHGGHRDRFDLTSHMAAEPLDLVPVLRQLQPTLVHVSCRGGQDAGGLGQDASS